MEEDHHRLDQLWESASSKFALDPALSERQYTEFRDGLLRHIEAEEEILFPFYEERGPDAAHQLVEVLREEHREIRETLARLLAAVRARAGERAEAEENLKNLLWAHNAREEGVLYPWCDDSSAVAGSGAIDHGVRAKIGSSPRIP